MKSTILIAFLALGQLLQAQPTCNWAYIPVGTGFTQNNIYYATTDQQHNIIELGKLMGVADMDPSPLASDTSYSYPSYNYYLSKTDSAGHLLWIKYFQQNSQIAFIEFKGLKVDNANDIVVLGNYYGMIDFDFSVAGVDTLRSHLPTYPDFFVAKYDAGGNYKWANNFGDTVSHHISSQALALDQNNNILVCANPNGLIDVDPDNSQIHNTIGGNANIICYDSNGNYLWNNHITTVYSYGVGNKSLEVDGLGNAYLLSVGYYELTVNKFSNTGTYLWGKKFGDFASGARVTPQSLLIDNNTNQIIIAGTFDGTVDFDPDTSIANYTAGNANYEDGFIALYNDELQLQWINHYTGNLSFGNSSLGFSNNEITAIGSIAGTIDFGNNFTLNATSAGAQPFWIKLNNLGIAQNAFIIDGIGKFDAYIGLGNNNFVCTGYIVGLTDIDPSNATLNLTTSNTNFLTAVYQDNTITYFKDDNNDEGISIYPNPSFDAFTIVVSKDLIGTKYYITDAIGHLISTNKINQNIEKINASQLANGVYFIRFDAKETASKKLIKY